MRGSQVLRSALLLPWLGLVAGPVAGAAEVRVTDFGAEPDSRRNAVAAVARAL